MGTLTETSIKATADKMVELGLVELGCLLTKNPLRIINYTKNVIFTPGLNLSTFSPDQVQLFEPR
jgi:hypothetical protein